MIDYHEMEMRAMELFQQGKRREASELQDEFLQLVQASGEDHCSCPAACKFHGKCKECVIVHRGHGNHLPHCFQLMVNKRISALSALTEHSMQREASESE
ncbi:MAG: LPS biosynthesis protein [Armatimonadota bacterium]